MNSSLKPLALAAAMMLQTAGCAASLEPTRNGPELDPERWQCRNDLEIRCGAGACTAQTAAGFTPMSVSVEASGGLSVCAYSGCWEGAGRVIRDGPFLVVVGRGLEFSTAPGTDSARQNVVVAIDTTDSVGVLKAGEFAHPLLCELHQTSR